jgi:putative MATE family efflux protein
MDARSSLLTASAGSGSGGSTSTSPDNSPDRSNNNADDDTIAVPNDNDGHGFDGSSGNAAGTELIDQPKGLYCLPYKGATAQEWRRMIDLAAPLIVGYSSVNAMLTTDLAFVGQISAVDLAAMNLANAILFATLILPVGLTNSVRVLAACSFGAGQAKNVGLWVQVAILWTAILFIIPVSLIWWFTGSIVCLFGMEGEELDDLNEPPEGDENVTAASLRVQIATAVQYLAGGGVRIGQHWLSNSSSYPSFPSYDSRLHGPYGSSMAGDGNSTAPPGPPSVSAEEDLGAELCDKATEFARLSLLWLWPMVLYNIFASALEAVEIVLPVTIISIVFVGVNFAINWVFLVVLGWGLAGSAMATTVSKVLQLIVLMLVGEFALNVRQRFWGGWTREAFRWVRAKSFLILGLPMMLTEVLYDWTFEIAILLSGTFGIAQAGATGVLINLVFFFTPLLTGVYIAVTIRVSTLLGERDVPGAKRSVRISAVAGVVVSAMGVLLMVLLRNVIPLIYTADEEVIALVSKYLPLAAVDFVFSSFTYVMQGVLEGQARPHVATVSAMLGTWLVGLSLTLVLVLVRCF